LAVTLSDSESDSYVGGDFDLDEEYYLRTSYSSRDRASTNRTTPAEPGSHESWGSDGSQDGIVVDHPALVSGFSDDDYDMDPLAQDPPIEKKRKRGVSTLNTRTQRMNSKVASSSKGLRRRMIGVVIPSSDRGKSRDLGDSSPSTQNVKAGLSTVHDGKDTPSNKRQAINKASGRLL
jgi:hypothetical protein